MKPFAFMCGGIPDATFSDKGSAFAQFVTMLIEDLQDEIKHEMKEG